MKKTILCLAVCFSLVVGIPCGTALADDVAHYVWLPYCIKVGTYWTGLNIKAYYTTDTIKVHYSGTSSMYATNIDVPLDARGRWTGAVDSLLPTPADFESPSLLHIVSTKGQFTVTQFIGNDVGFAFQTFYAVPGNWADTAWPYPVAAPAELDVPEEADMFQ